MLTPLPRWSSPLPAKRNFPLSPKRSEILAFRLARKDQLAFRSPVSLRSSSARFSRQAFRIRCCLPNFQFCYCLRICGRSFKTSYSPAATFRSDREGRDIGVFMFLLVLLSILVRTAKRCSVSRKSVTALLPNWRTCRPGRHRTAATKSCRALRLRLGVRCARPVVGEWWASSFHADKHRPDYPAESIEENPNTLGNGTFRVRS